MEEQSGPEEAPEAKKATNWSKVLLIALASLIVVGLVVGVAFAATGTKCSNGNASAAVGNCDGNCAGQADAVGAGSGGQNGSGQCAKAGNCEGKANCVSGGNCADTKSGPGNGNCGGSCEGTRTGTGNVNGSCNGNCGQEQQATPAQPAP